MVFPGVQQRTWTYDREARAYYHHRFYAFEPDLNTENPAVQEEIRKIMGFWLQLGVSGFRVDAVPFIIETPPGEQPPFLRFEYLRELHDFLQWRTGDAILLAEANILPTEHLKYFGPEGDRMHMILNFQVNQTMFYAFATGDCRPLGQALQATRKRPEIGQWGIFLRSHDELDLGRLSDAQRQAVFKAFAPAEDMRLYGRGIRRRLATMLGGDRRRMELAYSLLFTLPGTPVVRYGDEIGMGDDLSLPERQSVRTPMHNLCHGCTLLSPLRRDPRIAAAPPVAPQSIVVPCTATGNPSGAVYSVAGVDGVTQVRAIHVINPTIVARKLTEPQSRVTCLPLCAVPIARSAPAPSVLP
jgi:maltose alpha-D-glucosyltransferase/alpha-amylase